MEDITQTSRVELDMTKLIFCGRYDKTLYFLEDKPQFLFCARYDTISFFVENVTEFKFCERYDTTHVLGICDITSCVFQCMTLFIFCGRYDKRSHNVEDTYATIYFL